MADIKMVGAKGFACEDHKYKHEHEHEAHHDREVHVDPRTLAGDGTKEHPLEVIGLPLWPSFANLTTLHVYARATGSDATGDGQTIETAYRTFQRAIRDIPRLPPPGLRVVVDITDLGLEVLPANFQMPAYHAPFGGDFENTYTTDRIAPFKTQLALEVIAYPKLASAVPPADQIILVDDLIGPGIAVDPDTNLVEIHTNKSYPVDSLKGLIIQGSTNINGIVWHNTAGPNSIIYITHAVVPDAPPSPFGGVQPLFALPAAPFSIREHSAEFQLNKNPTDIVRGAFCIGGSGSVGIRGIKFRINPVAFSPTAFNVQVWRSSTVFFEACDLQGIGVLHSSGLIVFINCVIRDAITVFQSCVFFVQGLMLDIPSMITPMTFVTAVQWLGFVIEGCAAIGAHFDPILPFGMGPQSDLEMRYGVIRNSIADRNLAQIADPANAPSPFFPFPTVPGLPPALQTPGHGIIFRGGGGTIDHVKIFGAAADAIHLEFGSGLLKLKSVTGGSGGIVFGDLLDTPNGGVGVFVQDGATVRVIDQFPLANPIPTVVAGVGGDMLVGDLAVRSWANFRCVAPLKQQYDITATAATGATGTGSRLFEKP